MSRKEVKMTGSIGIHFSNSGSKKFPKTFGAIFLKQAISEPLVGNTYLYITYICLRNTLYKALY